MAGPVQIPSLDRLAVEPELARNLPVDALTAILGRVGGLQAVIQAELVAARTTAAMAPNGPVGSAATPAMLTADEAAALLHWSRRSLLRRSRKLPFTRRLSRKVILFDRAGLRDWLATRRA